LLFFVPDGPDPAGLPCSTKANRLNTGSSNESASGERPPTGYSASGRIDCRSWRNRWKLLEQFQENCGAVFRPELRKNK